jgi:hypothetical protein
MLRFNNLKTSQYCYGKEIEYLIDTKDVSISNINTGLQTNSNFLKNGDYSLIISNDKQENIFEDISLFLKGKFKLSGSIEDNLFLKDIEEDNYIEYQEISDNKIIILINSEEFIGFDLKKDFFIYLLKIN